MTNHQKAYSAAILYACIIGFSFIFIKIALTEASVMDILAHRFTVALLIATVIILFKKTSIKMPLKDLWTIVPLALLYPGLFFLFQAFGLVYSSSSEAGIIQATIPIFTLLFATFFIKERSNNWQLASILLSVAGIIFLFIMNSTHVEAYSLKGAGLILLSAMAAAFYNVLARKLTRQYSLFTLTYVMTLFGFVTFNGLALTHHVVEQSVASFFTPLFTPSFLVAILYLGSLSSLCTSFLSNYALSVIEASKMSVFSNLATLITIIAGVIFLNETLQFYHLVGAVIILAGVIGVNYFGNKGRV